MATNKVVVGGETIVDLTNDTVAPQSLLSGYSAHNKAGELIQGLAVIPTKVSELENDEGFAKTVSPVFTGVPKAPTPDVSKNDTQIATTAFVKSVVSVLIDGAPETLDTLKEIADTLGENEEVIQTLNSAIGNKVDKVEGKGLSTNDFTNAEKDKLSGVATNANNYSLPIASSTVRGGAKVGYTENGKNYPVELSNEQMFVNVPWTDNNTWKANTADSEGYVAKGSGQANKVWKTDANGVPGWRADANTTYSNFVKSGSDAKAGLVPAPATTAGTTKFLNEDGTWKAPPQSTVTLTNNLLATTAGTALDAAQGKVLDDKISAVNNNLNRLIEISEEKTETKTFLNRISFVFDFKREGYQVIGVHSVGNPSQSELLSSDFVCISHFYMDDDKLYVHVLHNDAGIITISISAKVIYARMTG